MMIMIKKNNDKTSNTMNKQKLTMKLFIFFYLADMMGNFP